MLENKYNGSYVYNELYLLLIFIFITNLEEKSYLKNQTEDYLVAKDRL